MKLSRKLMVLCAMMMMVVMCASACQKKAPKQEAAEGGKKKIGVSLLKENDDFYITLKKGLDDAAKAMGYEIVILSADNDELKQDKNMDTLLLQGVDAIVICPVNSMGVGAIIGKANAKNIPVFTADIAAKSGDVVAHIASDNYMGGKLAAERMISLIGKGGTVALIQQPGTESVTARVAGFVDTAKAGGLQIIEPYYNGKNDTQESERATDSAIKAHPDIKGVFAANDNMAGGAAAAITASGKDIKLIGYDAAPSAQEQIKKGGAWVADVIQYPGEIGKVTVETIDKVLKGELKAEAGKTTKVPVKVGLVDAESLNAAK